MSKQSNPLARSELHKRETDTRTPPAQPPGTPEPVDPTDPFGDQLTLTILGVVMFAIVVVVLVARTLYSA